ncbi:helix-turn-helix domain-containing protein [Halococcus saccharolyticus]|uniref:DNA-binding protein n=1 Tax=Halococcus saccharolyticus DSM 5350 TaxID=1227455 RepID=M0ML35_9EURY|nr:helix-turn-helix domain-containing protein [Halococcus saccharolyticus]EMA46073.1 DNA-binding protein [Halococcus saccharolyticus DSM 5350]
MPRANLTLTIPESVWIGEVSRAHPEATFRILAALADDDAGVGLAEVTSQNLSSILSEINASDSIVELDILRQHGDEALIQFETTMPLLLFPVQDSGVPLEMPFTIEEGEANWEITAPQRRLSELGNQFEQFEIPFTVNEIHQHIEPTQLLTDSQLELVRTAIEQGYYDTPRRCSLTDLAAESDVAKSTCSETLHRAEEKIMKRFVEDLSEATSTERT